MDDEDIKRSLQYAENKKAPLILPKRPFLDHCLDEMEITI